MDLLVRIHLDFYYHTEKLEISTQCLQGKV